MSEILIGVSACLLGEQVRYDGGHKRNAFLLEELASHVRFVPVCPEVGIGLGVPRETIRLVRRGDRVRLLGSAGVDHTDAMRRWAGTVMGELCEQDLSGFVLKKGSPSCGLERVRVWDEGAQRPSRPARGVFAQTLVDAMSSMSPPATLVMWFQLRSPELAEDFERLMTEDRDIVRGSLDTVSEWRLTRPADVPGQSIGQADYVLIVEIVEVDRFEQQASEHVQRLADDLAHLVSSRGMLVLRPVL